MIIIYLDKKFNPVSKERAVMAKVFQKDKPPYFVTVEKPAKKPATK